MTSVTFRGNVSIAEDPAWGYVFLARKSDHPPRHVHVYREGRFIVKWDLENRMAMKGHAPPRFLQLIERLEAEGRL